MSQVAEHTPWVLTPMQERFCVEYVKDLNATRAVIRAGYGHAGASAEGGRLLANVMVRERVEELKAEIQAATLIDAGWVMRRLRDELEADEADLFDENEALLPIREWPAIWRKGLITGFEVEERYEDVTGEDGVEKRIAVGRVVKVKFASRDKRLELLGRHVDVRAFADQPPPPPPNVTNVLNLNGLSTEALRLLAGLTVQQPEAIAPPVEASPEDDRF